MINSNPTIEEIWCEYKGNLANLEVNNPQKILIAFSGISGSGKTTLAKEIASRYNAVRITNDEIRLSITSLLGLDIPNQQVHELTKQYSTSILDKVASTPNQRIILDGSIDRSFEALSQWSMSRGFELFIIGMDTSKEEAKKRLHLREGKDAHHFINLLERQWEDFVRFREYGRVDFHYVAENKENLISLLDRKFS